MAELTAMFRRLSDADDPVPWRVRVDEFAAQHPGMCVSYDATSCPNPAPDWRTRCLAAEAERDAMRPVVEAAIREVTELASTNYNDARKDLGEAAVRTLTAFIRLSDAVDAYRAKEKT